MKKYLPVTMVLLVLLGIAGFVFMRKGGNATATLTPSEDGHWLKLNVNGINSEAKKMEYELIYSLPDDRVQGVPGSIDIEGESSLERDILLGTESSGIYYYDEGVNNGELTLKFYASGEKPIEEYKTDWDLEDLRSNPKVF